MEKRTFLINQTVEMNAVNDVYRYGQPLEHGDGCAHEWRVTVLRNRQVVNLEGMTARCLITRSANAAEREKGIATVTVLMEAQVNAAAGIISCVFDAGCYAGVGAVSGVMALIGEDGQSTTVAEMSARAKKTGSDALSDPDDLIMSVTEISAAVKEMQELSAGLPEAAQNANTAAASAVGAAERAEEAAAAIEGLTVSAVESDAARAEIMETNRGKHMILYIPKGKDGADGTSFVIRGMYATLDALTAAHATGSAGDAYAVGDDISNQIYIWDVDAGAWVNMGALQGPAGKDGSDGKDGANGADGYTPQRGTDYWTAEDQAQIVSDVLAALPNASGVSF